jgi:hypothetical protein
MKIWAFGDSHAGKFGVDKRFELVGPPAPTAYGLANEHSRSESVLMLRDMLWKVNTEDIILFVLGEIDCRIHVHRIHVETGKSYLQICTEIVERYGHMVCAVRDDNNVNVAVLDVPPAVAQGNVYGYFHYGTRDQRAAIALIFNHVLREWCERNSVCLVSIYGELTDERGWLKEEYAVEDEAHVKHTAVPFVVEELARCFPQVKA